MVELYQVCRMFHLLLWVIYNKYTSGVKHCLSALYSHGLYRQAHSHSYFLITIGSRRFGLERSGYREASRND